MQHRFIQCLTDYFCCLSTITARFFSKVYIYSSQIYQASLFKNAILASYTRTAMSYIHYQRGNDILRFS